MVSATKPKIVSGGESEAKQKKPHAALEQEHIGLLRNTFSKAFSEVDSPGDLHALGAQYAANLRESYGSRPQIEKAALEVLGEEVSKRDRELAQWRKAPGESGAKHHAAGGVHMLYNVRRPQVPEIIEGGRSDADAVRNGDSVRKALDALEVSGAESPRLGFVARGHEIRFTRKAFEQVQFLREISESGMDAGDVREIPAYFFGRKAEEGGREHYAETHVEVPPFNSMGSYVVPKPRLHEVDLKPGEVFLGTFHTHPAGYDVFSAQDISGNGIARMTLVIEKNSQNAYFVNGEPENEKGIDQWHFNIIAPRGDRWRIFEMDPKGYDALAEKYPVGKVGLARIEEMRELECTPRDLK